MIVKMMRRNLMLSLLLVVMAIVPLILVMMTKIIFLCAYCPSKIS
jgi:hypothetical protein